MAGKNQISISLSKQFRPLISEIRKRRADLFTDTEVIKEAIRQMWQKEIKEVPAITAIPASKPETKVFRYSDNNKNAPSGI